MSDLNSLATILINVEKLIKTRKWDIALTILNKLCIENPKQAEIPAEIGIFFQSRNMPLKAEMFYLESLKINNSQATLYYNLGIIYQSLERTDEAVNAYRSAININSNYARAYANLAYLYHQIGDTGNCIETFKSALKEDPDNPQIKHMMLSCGIGETPDTADKNYIRNTFDEYADRYDDHLISKLKSQTPKLTYEATIEHITRNNDNKTILDLGCGTGLCGELFGNDKFTLTGVDLSEKMIAEARKKKIYKELYVSEINEYINNCMSQYDAVIASDVFVYIGKLDDIISNIKKIMKDNSIFTFTIETLDENNDDYILETTGRYKHNPSYIDRLINNCNFKTLLSEERTIRQQHGKHVTGHIYTIQKLAG